MGIAKDVGYIKGTVDAMKEQNEEDHKYMKDRLDKGSEQFQHLDKRLSEQENMTNDHEERINDVEEKQKFIGGLASFVMQNPKIIIGITAVVIVLVTGLSFSEVMNRLGG